MKFTTQKLMQAASGGGSQESYWVATFEWNSYYQGHDIKDVVIDDDGNIYVSGQANSDPALWAFDTDGNELWTKELANGSFRNGFVREGPSGTLLFSGCEPSSAEGQWLTVNKSDGSKDSADRIQNTGDVAYAYYSPDAQFYWVTNETSGVNKIFGFNQATVDNAPNAVEFSRDFNSSSYPRARLSYQGCCVTPSGNFISAGNSDTQQYGTQIIQWDTGGEVFNKRFTYSNNIRQALESVTTNSSYIYIPLPKDNFGNELPSVQRLNFDGTGYTTAQLKTHTGSGDNWREYHIDATDDAVAVFGHFKQEQTIFPADRVDSPSFFSCNTDLTGDANNKPLAFYSLYGTDDSLNGYQSSELFTGDVHGAISGENSIVMTTRWELNNGTSSQAILMVLKLPLTGEDFDGVTFSTPTYGRNFIIHDAKQVILYDSGNNPGITNDSGPFGGGTLEDVQAQGTATWANSTSFSTQELS